MRKLSWVFAMMLLAGLAGAQPVLRLKGLKRDATRRSRPLARPHKTRTPGRSHLLVQFADNPGDDQLTELANRGAAVLSYIPDFAFSIAAKDDTPLDGLNIQWIGRLEPGEKISPELEGTLASDVTISVLVEFYGDVDLNDGRAIANDVGLLIQENPDLMANHLLLSGTRDQVLAMAEWDEVAYIFPASPELVQGTPVHGCAGALTSFGQVGQAIPLIGEGWDGPGRGGADLKYAFIHVTEKLPADAAKAEIVRAYSEWAKYAKLTFTLSNDANGKRTLAVLFASGEHGDGYPFDGPGGVLAHTFYPFPVNPEPIAGDMHFDNDDNWKIGANIDLFSIALHETGHALGLGHSDKPGDVMFPYYRRVTGLAQDDISAILQIYAAQDGAPAPAPAPPPTPAPGPPPPVSPLVLTVQAPPSTTTASSIAIGGATSGGAGNVQVGWWASSGYSGVAQGSSNWLIPSIPLTVGANVITITARDSQQNQVIRSLTITRQQNPPPTPGPDTTPPSLTILSPATNNPSTSASSLIVSGTAHDNVGVAAVMWSSSNGGSGTATGTDNWTTPPIPLYVGATTITIRARDAAGNSSWRSVTVTRR